MNTTRSTSNTNSPVTAALQEFQQLLTPAQHTELKSLCQGSTPTADDVFQFTKSVEEAFRKKKRRKFVSRIHSFLMSVQQYCASIDVLVSSNPQKAALVWGSVKLLIMLSLNFTGYFVKLSEVIEQISAYCPRLDQYQDVFQQSPRFRNAVEEFYAIVILFCGEALRIVQGNGIKHVFKVIGLAFKDKFVLFQKSLQDAKSEIDEEIKLASEQRQYGIQNLQTVERRENQSFRQRQDVEIRRNQQHRSEQAQALINIQTRQIQKLVKEEERKKLRLFASICTWDYQSPLRNARGKRLDGTGTWFLSRPEFLKWRNDAHNSGLWLRSPAGYGKTVLVASIIDHLMEQRMQAQGDGIRVVYYFFTSLWQDSLSPVTFMRSILHQILSPKMLSSSLGRRIENLFTGLPCPCEPDISELKSLILDQWVEASTGVKQTFLIIDGLDEASSGDQKLILSFLMQVYKLRDGTLKIFTSAQPEVDLGSPFGNIKTITTIHVQVQDMQQDIDTYIQTKGGNDLNEKLQNCSEDLILEVKRILSRKAEGMFLWVVLQIMSICDIYELDGSEARIRAYLQRLPRSLEDIYRQAVRRIHDVTGDDYETTLRAFKFISCAKRPLTLAKLEEAVAIKPGQKAWAPSRIVLTGPDGLSRLSKRTANLVTLNELDQTITLSHHSVKTFLQSCSTIPEVSQFYFEPSNADICFGEICITYLNFADFENSLTKTTNSRAVKALDQPSNLIPLIAQESGQAADRLFNRSWVKQSSGKRPASYSAETYLRTLLGTTQSPSHDSHFKLRNYCSKNWYEHLKNNLPQDPGLIHCFRNLVFTKTLPFPFRPWETSNKADREALPYWNLFSWAVHGPYLALLQVWRDTVGEEIASDSWKLLWSTGGEALLIGASVVGNIDQVSLLLKNSPNPKGTGRPSIDCLSTVLCQAATLGNERLVQVLLDAGVDSNSRRQNHILATPLQCAARGGHESVVESLLQAGADVNAKDSKITALQVAAQGGHIGVVEQLIQAGADVHVGKTVLGTLAARPNGTKSVKHGCQMETKVSR